MHTNLSLMASQTFQNLKRSFFLFPFFVSLFFSAHIKSYGQISQLQRVTGWPKRHAVRYTVRWTALSSDLTWLFSVPRNSWPVLTYRFVFCAWCFVYLTQAWLEFIRKTSLCFLLLFQMVVAGGFSCFIWKLVSTGKMRNAWELFLRYGDFDFGRFIYSNTEPTVIVHSPHHLCALPGACLQLRLCPVWWSYRVKLWLMEGIRCLTVTFRFTVFKGYLLIGGNAFLTGYNVTNNVEQSDFETYAVFKLKGAPERTKMDDGIYRYPSLKETVLMLMCQCRAYYPDMSVIYYRNL